MLIHIYEKEQNNKNQRNLLLNLETGIVPIIGEILTINDIDYIILNRIRTVKNIYNNSTSSEEFSVEVSKITNKF